MASHASPCMANENADDLVKFLASNLAQCCHPQLRGGSMPFKHCFSPRQMVSLAAICDTIIPSLPLDSSHSTVHHHKLFALSASQAGVVMEVAGMLCAWTTRMQFVLAYLALLFLSTPLGTLLLCGLDSVTSDFPFVHTFSALPLERRESILLAWSRSVFLTLQMLFKVTKCYTVFKFFSMADDKGNNPSWTAIGYEVPRRMGEHEDARLPNPNPLESRLVDASAPNLSTRLAEQGCTVLDNLDHLRDPEDVPGTSKNKEVGVKCDVVVVGSGSGGGVIAAQLAKEGYQVIVVEKGGYFSPSALSLLEGPSMNAMYEQSGALTTQDGCVIFLAATTLGGGTAVNWSASLKTPKHVLEEWSGLGLDKFQSREYMQAMEAVCKRLNVQDECTEESFQNRVLRSGCKALGYPVGCIPRNSGKDHDCGFCGFGCPASAANRKQSGVETWLCDAARQGAVIITGCNVDKVITQPNRNHKKLLRSKGVYARVGAGEYELYIEAHATVVACGALFTPPLLTRSGLRNPHIGRHLSIHPVVSVWGYFPREDLLPGKSYHGGIMTSFSHVAANWDSSGYGCILETPCLHPGTFAALRPWRSAVDFKRRMLNYPRTATLIILNRDHGSGTVNQEQDGKLLIDYPLSPKDKENLISATVMALRVLLAAGAEEVGTDCFEGEVFSTRNSRQEEFDMFVRRVTRRMFTSGLSTPIMSAHQMGSCRMGVDALSSAVDKECETWEVEGLFVGDGSVVPSACGVNPMITIQSVAYCTSTSVATYLN